MHPQTGRPVKIRVENVSKVFGRDPAGALAKVRAGMGKTRLKEDMDHVLGLHDITLDIRAGEIFVIMGLSGSGKSTLIRHFNRLIEPTSGRILFDGEDILGFDAARLQSFRRRKVAMVFQRFALLPHKTVAENVAYGLTLDGIPKAEALRRASEQIALVGLTGFEGSYPAQLSGGMQQRVGLARALATNAEVLLMDEAFSALDPLIRHDMQVQLKELQVRLGKTIVFITHDLDEALLLGDHVAILKDGSLRQVGTGSEILARPADEYVARFVRDVNRGRILLCGAFADAGLSPAPDAPVVGADTTLEAAFAAFADGAQVVAVRNGDGRIAGSLTAQHVMQALARI